MTLQIGVVMDPIESINVKKDTTLAMLLAAQQKGWSVQYMTQPDLYSHGGVSRAKVRALTVEDNPKGWFQFGAEQDIEFNSLLRLEQEGAYRIPALVHSDLEVVDREGKRLAASYIAYQGLQIQRDSLVNQVQSNLVTGCTAVINEELAIKVLPIPAPAIMHDWWMAIAAVAYGRRLFIDRPLVRYRQHDANAIGAQPFVAVAPSAKSFWGKLRAYQTNPHLFAVAEQSRAVLRHHGGALSLRQRLGLQLLGCVNVRSGLLQILLFRLARYF